MPSGIILIDKPKGFTSFDVVAKMRGILGVRKIGHTGTLDPMATGLLVLCVGKATGLVEMLSDHDKTYEAGMLLGAVTDTQDTTGNVISVHPVDAALIEQTLPKTIEGFMGEQEQLPPMYSAKKVDGKRLYELARAGKEVKRKKALIRIDAMRITGQDLPHIKLTVDCSKGTYIRTLIHDMGQALGTGACMESLRRTRVGSYRLEDAYTFAEIEKMQAAGDDSFYISVESVWMHLPKVVGTARTAGLIENGNPIPVTETRAINPLSKDFDMSTDEKTIAAQVRLYHPDGRFAGIYENKKDVLKVVKNYLE